MTFSLTRPPSPSREPTILTQDHAEDNLSSALHAALSSFVPGSSAHPDLFHDMIREKEKIGIDVVVDSDTVPLKGTGVDIEPALLQGHIVLHLREPTSIREITLQFKGKARLPTQSSDTLPLSTSSQSYTICNHEWSFLEGEKRHSHTLKAGFHRFPFQLQLGGSLPSSISSVHGGAHVSYKLRAVAVRPGLAHNIQAIIPITLVRTFAPEALEYQQSLEIENTWPEKLMYSIMIPHKAWAAGDKLTAIVKFSPLAKGVRVLSVGTTITESTKLHSRSGVQEHSRSVVTANHEILNGHVMPVAGPRDSACGPPVPSAPGLSQEDRSRSFGTLSVASQDLALRQVPSRASSSSSSSSYDSRSILALPLLPNDPLGYSAEPDALTSTPPAEEEVAVSQNDIIAQLTLFIPKSATPSHALEPIVVSHRIRWSILMSNLDGHTSELRCSLPLHILDARLLDEARANSAATRRLLLGGPEAPVDEEQDTELPSYSAHVRDRVANMYLPDSATTRMLNPWVHSNVSPTFIPEHASLLGAWTPGTASPVIPHPASSHLPHVPQSGASTPLDWVNSELLLSLSSTATPAPRPGTTPHSHSPTDSVSRPESRLISQRNSRAPSPERQLTMTNMAPPALAPVSISPETFVHDSHASRTLPGLFSIQMKPHTSLTSPGWLSSRSNSHSNLASSPQEGPRLGLHSHRASIQSLYSLYTTSRQSVSNNNNNTTMAARAPTPAPVSISISAPTTTTHGHTFSMSESVVPERALWHRAFTEVPDYDVALRGFIGGVTPLTSMRGLPSYEEAARTARLGVGVGGGDLEEEEEGEEDGEDRVTIRRGGSRQAR